MVVDVDIREFTHQNVTVQVGDSVIWTNRDEFIPHTTTSGQPPENLTGFWGMRLNNTGGFDSSELVVFDAIGAFPYFCRIHNFMTGSVTVVENLEDVQPASETPAPTPPAIDYEGY